MFGPRRCGGGGGGGAQRRAERAAAAAADGNRYAETDPTGRYGRFNELLGKGAMKSVYRGFDEVNGVEVAWNQAKLCDVLRTPDALQRMYSEVHLLSTLRHDAVIGFHASWVDVSRRTFNFITEMFTSGTLREYRLRYPRVSIRAMKSWARQILQGLAYLHSHDPPVIHRDLKCDNIFINGHLGQVKIGDLGLAAVLRGTQSAHSVIGTPEFMAPELYEEDYNELVDIYSFGMCMLEMLTLDYPYSECCNPAQIYKKVTSGKLPDAYYRLEDKEARRFIGRCLVAASKRPSAEELLHDPFLSPDDHTTLPSSAVAVSGLLGAMETPESDSCSLSSEDEEAEPPARTDMTISGKLNHEDDTIFLKVQIADYTGYVRNIYFPYDILTDTAIDVANEMVKELEITDRDPSEIAAMIEQEIAMLVPGWTDSQQQECTYTDDDENEDGECPPFYYLSSSPTSSQGSLCGVGPSMGFSGPHGRHSRGGWFQDDYPFTDDDGMSSTHSGKYSALHYMSGNDEAQPEEAHGPSSRAGHRATRFGPDDSPKSAHSLAHHFQRQCHGVGGEHRRRLTRNRSMVDVRSQLLHRTLVEELNKRLFNTVGAVEDIGFRVPCYGSSSTSSSRRAAPPSLSSLHGGDHRRLKEKYRL